MAATLGNGTVTFGDGTTQSVASIQTLGYTFYSTPSTYNFTVPAGVTAIKITICAGGGYQGAGLTIFSTWYRGGQGGSGGRGTKWVTGLTPGTVLTVIVGTGGSSTTATGGSTSVSGSGMTTITATGGTVGGNATQNPNAIGAAGTAGTLSGSVQLYNFSGYGDGGLTSVANTRANGYGGYVLFEY